MSFVPATSSPKYSLFIPWQDDDFDQDEGAARNRRAENMRIIQQWANDKQPTKLFANIVCDGTQNSYTFNVPSGYTNMRFRIAGTSTSATASTVQLQFNGDTTNTHYFDQVNFVQYAQTSVSTNNTNGTFIRCGTVVSDTSRAHLIEGTVGLYANATYHKPVLVASTCISTIAFALNEQVYGLWESAAPITSVTFSLATGNFASATSIQAWGEF